MVNLFISVWKKKPLLGLYKGSFQWRYETERKSIVDIEAAKIYASEKGYQHIMYCHKFVDLEKHGFAIPNTAIFFRNSINLPWLGTSSQCDWYNKGIDIVSTFNWSFYTLLDL